MGENKTVRFTSSLKRRWIKALRSGKFTKGKRFLKIERSGRDTKYCCLGVLRELEPEIKAGEDVLGGCPVETLYDITRDAKYQSNVEGLSVEDQIFLTRKNDGGRSFNEIAAYIRDNIPAIDEKN